MFNSSLDAYGSVRRLAVVQSVAGSQIALGSPVGLKSVIKVESKPAVEIKQPVDVDRAALVTAVKKLNELVAPALQSVEFTLDQESERMVVKVVDTATKSILRQIPNEEVLTFSKTLDKLQGLVIRQTA